MSYFEKKVFLLNPLTNYLKWLVNKSKYQLKYWGYHLRLDYGAHASACTFEEYNYIGKDSAVYNCNFGRFTYVGDGGLILNANIGAFCSIGPNVKIAPGKHPTTKYVSTHPATFATTPFMTYNFKNNNSYINHSPVTIGNDVWIGTNVVIVDGITIGNGAIIGANSVVTKNVGDFEIVGGVPAKLIRKRFSEEQIVFLNQIKWWKKDKEWIKNNIKLFESINDFMDSSNK